jgi:hypothetical protein
MLWLLYNIMHYLCVTKPQLSSIHALDQELSPWPCHHIQGRNGHSLANKAKDDKVEADHIERDFEKAIRIEDEKKFGGCLRLSNIQEDLSP